MKHNRQSDAILDEMLQGRRITQLEMLQEHGVGRLASRISDLRNEGYLITSRRIPVEKGDGSRANVSQYWMTEGMYCQRKDVVVDGWTIIQFRSMRVKIYRPNELGDVWRIDVNRIKTEQELRTMLEQYIRNQEA